MDTASVSVVLSDILASSTEHVLPPMEYGMYDHRALVWNSTH